MDCPLPRYLPPRRRPSRATGSPRRKSGSALRLEPKYRDWLDLAKPLLTEDDLSRFLQLSAPEKDRFIREFWKRHSS
jgi:hypothetical protein